MSTNISERRSRRVSFTEQDTGDEFSIPYIDAVVSSKQLSASSVVSTRLATRESSASLQTTLSAHIASVTELAIGAKTKIHQSVSEKGPNDTVLLAEWMGGGYAAMPATSEKAGGAYSNYNAITRGSELQIRSPYEVRSIRRTLEVGSSFDAAVSPFYPSNAVTRVPLVSPRRRNVTKRTRNRRRTARRSQAKSSTESSHQQGSQPFGNSDSKASDDFSASATPTARYPAPVQSHGTAAAPTDPVTLTLARPIPQRSSSSLEITLAGEPDSSAPGMWGQPSSEPSAEAGGAHSVVWVGSAGYSASGSSEASADVDLPKESSGTHESPGRPRGGVFASRLPKRQPSSDTLDIPPTNDSGWTPPTLPRLHIEATHSDPPAETLRQPSSGIQQSGRFPLPSIGFQRDTTRTQRPRALSHREHIPIRPVAPQRQSLAFSVAVSPVARRRTLRSKRRATTARPTPTKRGGRVSRVTAQLDPFKLLRAPSPPSYDTHEVRLYEKLQGFVKDPVKRSELESTVERRRAEEARTRSGGRNLIVENLQSVPSMTDLAVQQARAAHAQQRAKRRRAAAERRQRAEAEKAKRDHVLLHAAQDPSRRGTLLVEERVQVWGVYAVHALALGKWTERVRAAQMVRRERRAAVFIQCSWKGYRVRIFVRAVLRLRHCIRFRLLLYRINFRIKQKRAALQPLRWFLVIRARAKHELQAGRSFQSVYHKFVRFVRKAQQLMRDYIACRRARIMGLTLLWIHMESRMIRQLSLLESTPSLPPAPVDSTSPVRAIVGGRAGEVSARPGPVSSLDAIQEQTTHHTDSDTGSKRSKGEAIKVGGRSTSVGIAKKQTKSYASALQSKRSSHEPRAAGRMDWDAALRGGSPAPVNSRRAKSQDPKNARYSKGASSSAKGPGPSSTPRAPRSRRSPLQTQPQGRHRTSKKPAKATRPAHTTGGRLAGSAAAGKTKQSTSSSTATPTLRKPAPSTASTTTPVRASKPRGRGLKLVVDVDDLFDEAPGTTMTTTPHRRSRSTSARATEPSMRRALAVARGTIPSFSPSPTPKARRPASSMSPGPSRRRRSFRSLETASAAKSPGADGVRSPAGLRRIGSRSQSGMLDGMSPGGTGLRRRLSVRRLRSFSSSGSTPRRGRGRRRLASFRIPSPSRKAVPSPSNTLLSAHSLHQLPSYADAYASVIIGHEVQGGVAPGTRLQVIEQFLTEHRQEFLKQWADGAIKAPLRLPPTSKQADSATTALANGSTDRKQVSKPHVTPIPPTEKSVHVREAHHRVRLGAYLSTADSPRFNRAPPRSPLRSQSPGTLGPEHNTAAGDSAGSLTTRQPTSKASSPIAGIPGGRAPTAKPAPAYVPGKFSWLTKVGIRVPLLRLYSCRPELRSLIAKSRMAIRLPVPPNPSATPSVPSASPGAPAASPAAHTRICSGTSY